jgi:hypothetical protein
MGRRGPGRIKGDSEQSYDRRVEHASCKTALALETTPRNMPTIHSKEFVGRSSALDPCRGKRNRASRPVDHHSSPSRPLCPSYHYSFQRRRAVGSETEDSCTAVHTREKVTRSTDLLRDGRPVDAWRHRPNLSPFAVVEHLLDHRVERAARMALDLRCALPAPACLHGANPGRNQPIECPMRMICMTL